MSSKKFHVEHNPKQPKMSTPNTAPALPSLQLVVEAEIRRPSQYTPTEGSNAGRTYYSADAELATPGARWSTIRIRVRSKTPLVAGRARLNLVQMDANKGEAIAELCTEA